MVRATSSAGALLLTAVRPTPQQKNGPMPRPGDGARIGDSGRPRGPAREACFTPETGDRRPETGDRRPETGDRRPETGKRHLGVGACRGGELEVACGGVAVPPAIGDPPGEGPARLSAEAEEVRRHHGPLRIRLVLHTLSNSAPREVTTAELPFHVEQWAALVGERACST